MKKNRYGGSSRKLEERKTTALMGRRGGELLIGRELSMREGG